MKYILLFLLLSLSLSLLAQANDPDRFGTLQTNGSGTVTNFSAGDLSPIFTTSEATTTTTPALTFGLTAAAANTVLGNPTGSSAPPSYSLIVNGQITANTIDGTRLSPMGASLNDILTFDGTDWVPGAFSTTLSIGAFQTTGDAEGLSLSGTSLRAHRATTLFPGMVTADTQSFSGQKTIIAEDTMQLVLASHGDGLLGIDFYDIDGADVQAQIRVTGIAGNGTVEFRTLNSGSGGLTRTFLMDEDRFQLYPGTRTGTFENASLTNETFVTNSTPGSLVANTTYQYISSGSDNTFTLPTSGNISPGNVYKIWNESADGVTITLNPGSGTTINGSGTGIIFNLRGENAELHVVGTDYRIHYLRN